MNVCNYFKTDICSSQETRDWTQEKPVWFFDTAATQLIKNGEN